MENAGLVIGILSFLLVFLFMTLPRLGYSNLWDKYQTGRVYELANNFRMGDLGYLQNQWAEFFRDEDYTTEMMGIPYGLKFKYYGGTWQLAGASELYWVYDGFRGMLLEKPEYKSSWNYWRNDFKSMKYIMENHPNLRNARKGMTPEDRIPKIIKD